jgi:hypothetical protein
MKMVAQHPRRPGALGSDRCGGGKGLWREGAPNRTCASPAIRASSRRTTPAEGNWASPPCSRSTPTSFLADIRRSQDRKAGADGDRRRGRQDHRGPAQAAHQLQGPIAPRQGDRVVIDFTGRKDGEEFRWRQGQRLSGDGRRRHDAAGFRGPDGRRQGRREQDLRHDLPRRLPAANLAGKHGAVRDDREEGRGRPPARGRRRFRQVSSASPTATSPRCAPRSGQPGARGEARMQASLKEQVMDALLKVNPIEVPKALVGMESEQMAEAPAATWRSRGMGMKNIPVEAVVVHRAGDAPRQAGPDAGRAGQEPRTCTSSPSRCAPSSTNLRKPSRTPRKWCAGTIPSRNAWPRPRRWPWRTTWWSGCWPTPRCQTKDVAFDALMGNAA